MEHFANRILELKRSKNVMLLNESQRVILETFRDLGENNMESKDITKLYHIITKAILKIMVDSKTYINGVAEGDVRILITPRTFSSEGYSSALESYKNPEHSYYRFKHKEITERQKEQIDWLDNFYQDAREFMDKYQHVAKYQVMRNGKPSKPASDEDKLEAKKGKLDPMFHDALEIIKVEVRASETDRWNKIMLLNAKVNGITYDPIGKAWYEEEEIKKRIGLAIDSAVLSTAVTIADKLGGFTPKSKVSEVTAEAYGQNTFTTRFKFDNGSHFTLCGNVVINCSPLGNEFYQYPVTFHNMVVDGKKIKNSEYNFKSNF